jgi:predicted O-methyltransferase YrrM
MIKNQILPVKEVLLTRKLNRSRMPAFGAHEIFRCIHTGFRSFFFGANTSSLRFWSRPKDAYRYWNACLFLRDSMGPWGLQKKQVWQVFRNCPNEAQVHFPALPESLCWIGYDPSYLSDLVHLALLCQAVRARTVFEIGTSTGYSSLFLAANTPPDGQIWTLDLPGSDLTTNNSLTLFDRHIVEECHKREPCFVDHPLNKKIKRVYGDSAEFDFWPYRESIDLFFVDGAHTFKYVRSDTINALRCSHPGSVIVWHDYRRSGLSRDVTKWLEQLSRIVAVYAAEGSSLAFMPCDSDCKALAEKLEERTRTNAACPGRS